MRKLLYYVTMCLGCTAAKHYRLLLSVFFISINLLACSSSNLTNPISLSSNPEGKPLDGLNAWQIQPLDPDLDIYRIIKNVPELHDEGSYATAISQCGVGNKASALATTRQLLVGLKDISLKRQQKFMYEGSRVLFSLFSAKLDEHDLQIGCFSFRHGNCVNDLIVWNENASLNSLVSLLSDSPDETLLTFARNFPMVFKK